MASDEEVLRALGLTEYGARAYRALVALGPASAATVAEAAPIPRTKAYAVLGDLVQRGWVDVETGRPKRYRAKRPRDCFERERRRLDEMLEATLPRLEEHYNDNATRFVGQLWLLQGGLQISSRTLEMIQRARENVLLIASFPLPADEGEIPRALKAAIKRGVRVRLAVPDADHPHAKALAVPGVEVRLSPVPPRVLAIDGRQALLTFPVPTPGGGVDLKGIWNVSPELLDLMSAMMSYLWDQGDVVAPGRFPARN